MRLRVPLVPALATLIVGLAPPCPVAAGPLHDAATAGDVEQVRALLRQHPAGVDEVERSGWTALHFAAAAGKEAVVDALLAAGANPRAAAPDGSTPLHNAALARSLAKLEINSRRSGMDADLLRQLAEGKTVELSTAQQEYLRGDVSRLYDGTEATAEAEAAHLAIVRRLIAAGADVNAVSAAGAPVCSAALSFRKGIILTLLDAGADPATHSCPGDTTPLHLFVMVGNREDVPEVIRRLAARGADLNAREQHGGTPLGVAVAAGNLPAARSLIEHGADVNAHSWLEAPLFAGVKRGNPEMVKLLIASGATLQVKSVQGWTLLNEAVASGSRDVAAALLAAGVDVNATDDEGFTALMTAAERDDRAIVEMLLAAHADLGVQNSDGKTALSRAVGTGYAEIVGMLLAAGADPRQVVRAGATVLHLAAREGHVKIARMLVERGAPVDVRADDGTTPLHWAGFESSAAASAAGAPGPGEGNRSTPAADKAGVARLLLERGADIEARANDGDTPLMTAAAGGHVDVTEALVAAKARIDARRADGGTALIAAASNGHAGAVRALLAAGADVAVKGANRATALHWGARFPDVTKELLEGGADPNATDAFGQTPLFNAVAAGEREGVSLLLAAGADIGHVSTQDNTVADHPGISARPEMMSLILELAEKAAAGGSADARNFMGRLYQRGTAVSRDYQRALDYYRRAAEQGHADAQNNLGWMYQNGFGVPMDAAEALRWYRKSADQGHPVGLNNVGMLLIWGLGAARDPEEGLRWVRKAAERGHPDAQVTLGTTLHSSGDYDEARTWLIRATNTLHPGAFAPLAEMSYRGQGVKASLVEAVSWLLLGAALGDQASTEGLRALEERTTGQEQAEAYNMARLWQDGWNRERRTNFLTVIPPRNAPTPTEDADSFFAPPAVPLDALIAAAEGGDLEAQAGLGRRYLNGEGGAAKDAAAAAAWLGKAAAKGSAEGQLWLGVLLARGDGVPADYVQARKWLVLAARAGHPKAPDLVATISGWMTEEQIAESERQAGQFKP